MRRLLLPFVLAVVSCNGSGSAASSGDAGASSGDAAGDAAASSGDAAGDAAAHAGLKRNYGHYFATNYDDTATEAAALCAEPGVTGINFRQTWQQVEPSRGVYDFSAFDKVLNAIALSGNPHCQLWLFVEFKSFANSPIKNPCPKYLQAHYSAPNANGNGAATCFMWEPTVIDAYVAMMKAAGTRYDGNARVEGLILEESALSLTGATSQDVAAGGTYTPAGWRDGLIKLIDQCSAAFPHSRCMSFLNFLNGNQSYLADVSAAISAVPNNQACYSGPDLLPNNSTLYDSANSTYELLVSHTGCRSNSAQNDSYQVPACGLECIFKFAVSGTFGSFPATAPRTGGVCVNSYIFWNHLLSRSATGLDWTDALPVIAAHPYGPGWYSQCTGGGGAP